MYKPGSLSTLVSLISNTLFKNGTRYKSGSCYKRGEDLDNEKMEVYIRLDEEKSEVSRVEGLRINLIKKESRSLEG